MVVALAAAALAVTLGVVGFLVGRITAAAPSPPRTIAVLVTTTDLAPGTPITPSDFTTVNISARDNRGNVWLPASQASSTQGRYTTTEVPKGSLLGPRQLTTNPPPGRGTQIVGIDLKANQAPTAALRPGVHVRVLYVPAASQPPYPAAQTVTTARIWSVAPDRGGGTNVDLSVPSGTATTIAAAAAHDEIALVLIGQRPPKSARATTPLAAR
ncbi:MAG: hypothetical protein J2P59_08590 [Acidimicrobiales bacterium]|nr:hypothetical protein [Acidimicrobiales bacterium]